MNPPAYRPPVELSILKQAEMGLVEIDFSIQYIDLKQAIDREMLDINDSLINVKKDSRGGKRKKPKRKKPKKRKSKRDAPVINDDSHYIYNIEKQY